MQYRRLTANSVRKSSESAADGVYLDIFLKQGWLSAQLQESVKVFEETWTFTSAPVDKIDYASSVFKQGYVHLFKKLEMN